MEKKYIRLKDLEVYKLAMELSENGWDTMKNNKSRLIFKRQISINYNGFQFNFHKFLQVSMYFNKFLSISIFIFIILSISISGYAQNADLKVSADVRGETLVLDPQGSAPAVPVEGQVYYDDNTDEPYYYDGSAWKVFSAGGTDKNIATKIVAASDSLDVTRADYTCDGTDDQQEINKAINLLPAGGGIVYLLEGTYNISAALLEGEVIKGIVPHTNTAIIGTGAGTVLKIVTGANNVNVINASSVSGILISQLKIDGNKINVAGTSYGIYFNTVTNSKVNKVLAENIRLGGIYLNISSSNTICDNFVMAVNWDPGIKLLSANNNIIENNIVLNGKREGILINSSSNNIVSSNVMSGNEWSNLCLITSSLNNLITNNNIVAKNIGGGIAIDSSSNNVICGNNVQGSYSQGISCQSSANNNSINNNIIQDSVNHGIVIQVSNGNMVGGNMVYNNGGIGNFSGIWLTDSDNNVLFSNRIVDGDGTGYGINLFANTCDNNYLVGNLIDGAGYIGSGYDRRIYDLGTSTKYTDKTKITLEPGSGYSGLANGGTLMPDGPTSYLRLTPAADVDFGSPNIAAGKSAGDILILENTTVNKIKITRDATTKLHAANIKLEQNDSLALLWNGTAWVEIGYGDN